MDKHLHIISLTVPYPVDFGGVFDIFYKIVSLHKAGVKIHLHCFSNEVKEQPILNNYCSEVFYYRRKKKLSFRLPYIVSSRINEELLNRLNQDGYPILAEGIHCSGLLLDKRFEKRKVFLRLHNVEHLYYRQLFLSSSAFFKRIYYYFESLLLKKYERYIAAKPFMIIAVSESDVSLYKRLFKVDSIQFLPVFTGFHVTSISEGSGSFCLYHGNLSVAENEKAVFWLLNKVFNHLEFPLVIAGKAPSRQLIKAAADSENVTLISDPSESELKELIRQAQVHVLPSFNNTGVKLKLINALFNGRHCVVNAAATEGSGIENLCIVADDETRFTAAVSELFSKPFTTGAIRKRKDILEELFNDERNCTRLIQMIW